MIISSNVGYLVSCYFMVYLVWDFKWIISGNFAMFVSRKVGKKREFLGERKKGMKEEILASVPQNGFLT